jgi:uncharacterized protein with HEPN domain
LPSERPIRRLEDILANIERIERLTTGMVFAAFVANEQTFDASLHAPLIVSEGAGKLGNETDTLIPGRPWRDIRIIGNVLRHRYDGVNPNTVWRIIAAGDLEFLNGAVGAPLTRLRVDQGP